MVVEYFSQFGAAGLFVLAFVESIFFPVPPDGLLVPLTVLAPEKWVLFSIMASVGSVAGAGVGYWLGKKGGRPLLTKLFKEWRVQRVEHYYQQHGDLAVFIAGFSPIPYKVFTIASGVFNHHFWRFLLFSAISRSIRFFVIGYLSFRFGNDVTTFLSSQLLWVSVVVAVALVGGYVIWRYWLGS